MHGIDRAKAGQMKKLRCSRRLALSAVAAAAALLCVPAGSLAAEVQSEARSTLAGEGTTESTEGTESSPPAEAPAPGWIPQDDAAEETTDAAAPAQRGSSLGSGGGSDQPRSPAPQPAVEEPEPAPASRGPYEPAASSPSSFEEPASAPEAAPAPAPEPQPVEPAARPTPVGLSAADAVGAPSQGAARPAIGVKGMTASGTGEQAGSGADALPWPVLIGLLLIFLYAGARVLLGPVELDLFRSGPFRRRRGYPRA